MEPFDQGYHTDSGDEAPGELQWPSSNVSASLSARHAALMRDELEISPLVPAVPPMPGERSSDNLPGPGLPSSFKTSNQAAEHPQLALKKRKAGPDVFDKDDFSTQSSFESSQPTPKESTKKADFIGEKRSIEACDGSKQIEEDTAPTKRLKPDVMQANQVNPASRSNIRDIVLGCASPSKPSDVSKGDHMRVQTSHDEAAELKNENCGKPHLVKLCLVVLQSNQRTKKEKMWKKQLKLRKNARGCIETPKKVLIAKKELEQAYALLREQGDLLDCLDKKDCVFLADNFWIFTVQQLSSILVPSQGREMTDDARNVRLNELLSKIETSGYLHEGAPREGEKSEEDRLKDRNKAEALVAHWKEKIASYLNAELVVTPVEERYPLDGPVSCLFPKATQNFLASVPIKTLWKFLSLKKTESGAICHMFKIWRRMCHLSTLSPLALAKHLLGITTRIEFAFSAIPSVSAKDREWMGDPIIILTGAAREFLVENQGLMTAQRFVSVRTKNLSINLELWRQRKNLPPLKGSGKVAMISGWKATAREALDAEAEPGKILQDMDFEALAMKDILIVSEKLDDGILGEKTLGMAKEDHKPKDEETVRGSGLDRQLKYAMHAQLFLEDVLGETITKLLSSVQIKSAAELFAVSQVDSKRAELYGHMKTHGCAKDNIDCKTMLKSWCDKLEKELNQFRPVMKKTRRNKESVEYDPFHVGESKDPFRILSSVTQSFLSTVGIRNAAQFLTSRTTDIADAFVKWREENGMPALKGQGSIASVSGWKASCRKAAKMLGLNEVASLEPSSRANTKSSNKMPGLDTKHILQSSTLPSFMLPKMENDDRPKETFAHILDGRQSQAFAVAARDGRTYQFQLQLRHTEASKPVIYFTYIGEMMHATPVSGETLSPQLSLVEPWSRETESLDLPILHHVVALSSRMLQRLTPFGSTLRGLGLIDIKRYGVRPVKAQPLTYLKQEAYDFVLRGIEKSSCSVTKPTEFANVLLRRLPFGRDFQYLLFLSSTVEKGQSAEIIFPLVDAYMKSGVYNDFKYEKRLLIEDALQLLSWEDLKLFLHYVEVDIADSLAKLSGTDKDEAEVHGARRRLHWLALRVHQILTTSGVTIQNMGELYYRGPKADKNDAVSVPADEATSDDMNDSSVPADKTTCDDINVIEDSQTKTEENSLIEDSQTKTEENSLDSVSSDGSSTKVTRNELEKEISAALSLGSLGKWQSTFSSPLVKKINNLVKDAFLDAYLHTDGVQSVTKTVSSSLETWMISKTPADIFLITITGKDKEALLSEAAELCEAYDLSLDMRVQDIDAAAMNHGLVNVIVCTKDNAVPEGDSRSKLQMWSDQEGATNSIDYNWYRQLVWTSIYELFHGLRSLMLREEFEHNLDDATLNYLRNIVQAWAGGGGVTDPNPTSLRFVPLVTIADESPQFVPHALPLFLGLVWPILRNMNWRAEASDIPGTLCFIHPAKGKQDLSEKSRSHRVKRRWQIIRKCKEIGLGDLPKLTKRLFVNVGDVGRSVMANADATVTSKSAHSAILLFTESVVNALEADDIRGADSARKITNAVEDCLHAIAPGLSLATTTWNNSSTDSEANSSEFIGTDKLMQFLLIVPALLRQCSLPLPAIRDCMDVIQSLLEFISTQRKSLLDAALVPPEEYYVKDEKPTYTGLASRLRIQHFSDSYTSNEMSNMETNSEEAVAMTEVILDSEKDQLTTFLVRVLEQAIPCRASDIDALRKNRHIYAGYPGFMCRHCRGARNEGKYFFTTLESLTTASAVFEKHIMKCSSVPADIKTEVITSKVDHAEERRHLPTGAQQAFFNRLWDRLRSSEIEGRLSRFHVENKDEDDAQQSETSGDVSFSDHIAVLEYLRTSKSYIDDKALSDAMVLYYNCLEYGGRVIGTPAEPDHFCAEWLIRKVAPNMPWTDAKKKARLMPG